MTKYISSPIFLISFLVGLFFIYILGPDIKTIMVYPTPENIDKILFKDKSENCYSFTKSEIECPSDETLISNIPIQI